MRREAEKECRQMISGDQYWMGRDGEYSADLTEQVRGNAALLLERVNRLLAIAAEEHVEPGIDAHTGTFVASGWRPKPVNDITANAGKRSRHLFGLAIDLRDSLPERPLARWCLRNQDLLEETGLWMEDPRWTPNWVHLQAVPPGSGRRVYVPSTDPALVAALPEQTVV